MNADFAKNGLSSVQAASQLEISGLNELPQSVQESLFQKIKKLVKEPMLLLLLAAGAIYLVMGDLSEGLMLGASIFFVIGISYYQERKSENALAALRDLSSPRALVIRDGEERRISANQLVPGDLVALHEGDRVPADGFLLQASNFSVDESLLSGESFPAKKSHVAAEVSDQLFDGLEPKVKAFSSTLVISGTAFLRVMRTGVHTEVGKIGKSLQEVETEELNLSTEIRQIVRLFAWTGGIICVGIVFLYGFSHGGWTQAFLVGLSTQMALLPEEFPLVLTIFLALGAWRLSRVQVLVRRPASIERLGAVNVLCVDKTGTLTQNRMTVAALSNFESSLFIDAKIALNLSEPFHEVAEYGVLASHLDPFDPMEKAIRRMVEEGSWGKEHIHKDWKYIRDYPLSDKLFAMSCVWKKPKEESYLIASKGSPEAMIDLCHLEEEQAQRILVSAKEMASRGLRVLGVAKANFSQEKLPKDQHEFNFNWVGLIGLEDPLRPEVPAAIQKCRQAGIRVIMMTGDYPETALQIAKRAGIDTENSMILGSELDSLSDDTLCVRLKTAHIFARMIPAQKLRIVKLLKSLGHVVGMTGDGVNDAPSLKWADIGISMGARGTDVAREASDIVLLDDNFASIVSGIERGRLIFSNIRKAMSYIVSIHVPVAGLSFFPALFHWPLILFPVHIVFLEIIIDPACSLMFESQSGDESVMQSPPRALKARLFSGRDLLRSFLQGLFVLVVISGVLIFERSADFSSADRDRTFAFIILALSNIGLIFADMSGGSLQQLILLLKRGSNQLIILGVSLCLILATQVEQVRKLFHFGILTLNEIMASIGVALVVFVIVSGWNAMAHKYRGKATC